MIVLDHFDFERVREHLQRNPNGSVLLTMNDDREFTITDLDERVPGSAKVEATRFPDHRVLFDPATVTFSMLLPVDPRVHDGVKGEVEVSTRQPRRRKAISRKSNEHRPSA